MTTVQRAAQILGWVFILVGVVGMFYSYTLEMNLMLGLFPVNVVHNLFHILLGLWGISASKSFASAKSYATIAGLLYVVLGILGYLEATPPAMLPLHGNNV